MEFSDLALAKLLQTAPELGSLVLNFTEISDEIESRDVQVGLFILSTGAGLVFVPVIAKNDTIFPIDSVFIQDESRFAPLTPVTIKALLNASNLNQGKAKKIPNSVPINPDISSLINPPRTGKYVYSSASRLTEFLATLPQHLKDFTFEKIAGEQSVYEALDKMFGLKAIFEVLKSKIDPGVEFNVPETGPDRTKNIQPVTVVTSSQEVKALLDEALASRFVRDGFAVTGNPEFSRVAVSYQPYNAIGYFRETDPAICGNHDYNIVFKDGSSHMAYVPSYHRLSPGSHTAIIFSDGTYANGPALAMGDAYESQSVLNHLFETFPPKLLSDCYRGETVLLFTADGAAVGPFDIKNVVISPIGAEVSVEGLDAGKVHKIVASRNMTSPIQLVGGSLFVPSNIIAVVLGDNVTMDLERNPGTASARQQLIASQFLGAELDIRHDGVEYSLGGRAVGDYPQALKVLVERESLDPAVAQDFLKQAEQTKFVKVFLSKKAADSSSSPTPTEISQYGTAAADPGDIGPGGNFMANVSNAAGLGDSQVTECVVISQLLQSPDLFEMIQEYLPEIQASVDKLGRLLFLTRVNIDQLAGPLDSDSVFALISKIKNVYRQLGDTSIRLAEISAVSKDFEVKAPAKAATGV